MAALQEQEKMVPEKWEGKATAKLKGVKAEQVWNLFLDDFCSSEKWMPTIDTCRKVAGVNGQPGLIRYAASTPATPSSDDGDGVNGNDEEGKDIDRNIVWCHEKLTAVDSKVRSLSYEVTENNLRIKSYKSTIRVLPSIDVDDDDDDDEFGCEIQWLFSADPFEGGLMTYDALSSYINFSLQGIADNMERALKST